MDDRREDADADADVNVNVGVDGKREKIWLDVLLGVAL